MEEGRSKPQKNTEYYENSNTLYLLGFEDILQGKNKNNKLSSLKTFSESFFVKRHDKKNFFNKIQKSLKSSFNKTDSFFPHNSKGVSGGRYLSPIYGKNKQLRENELN